MDDYLSKPFQQDDLIAIMEQCLKGPSSMISSEKPDPPYVAPYVESPKEDTEIVSLDEGTIVAVRETMGEALGNIFDLFSRQTQERIEAMRAAVSKQDTDTLHRVSHSLKGSAGLIGAVRMTGLSEELQSLGSSEKVDGADDLLDRLADEFATVQSLLQAKN